MIFNNKKLKIYFFNEFIDMRKGHSSLSQIVTHKIKIELMDGALFFFVSKNKKTIKGLYFDGTGLVLIHKKLDAGNFMSFNNSLGVFQVNDRELQIIFHGGHIPLSSSGKRIKLKN